MSKLSSKGSKWERLRAEVLKRDGYQCAYCHAHADTADHVIPKARGGVDALWNLVAACRPCNGRKSDRDLLRTTYWAPGWGPM